MKTKVLYLAILLAVMFSLNIFAPSVSEDVSQPSSIDTTQIIKGGNKSTAGGSGFILILGAFGEEIDGVRRQLDVEEAIAVQNYELYRGKYENRDILLVRTGMGKERAESATKSVLAQYPVTAIVSLGFAGGLNPELETGEIVLCSTLYCANGSIQKDPNVEPCTSDASLISLAFEGLEDIEVNGRIGSCVTELELEYHPQQQQELFDTYHADVVEMESYWIARIASDWGIPFIAVRSMSDRGNEVQPFDQILTVDGELLWKEAVVIFTTHPNFVVNVFNLYLNVRIAHENMTACVLHLLTKM